MKNIKKFNLKKNFQKTHRGLVSALLVFCLLFTESCEDSFLDVVPDNLPTIEDAFSLKNEAEKYLFTCYSYLPISADVVYNFGLLAGDEAWIPPNDVSFLAYSHYISRGLQNAGTPYVDAWEGNMQGGGPPYPGGPFNGNYPIYDGIRHCNVLIERLEGTNQVPDLTTLERARWVAEAKFLKAYYHYFLMRMYGAIAVIRTNIPVDASEEEIQVSRDPFDESIDYLVQLLDQARVDLPRTQQLNAQTDLGRITRSAAYGLKAEILLMAASPLFNGNSDLIGVTNNDGTPLFNTTYDASKWQRAATAAKEAIDIAETDGHSLYYENDIAIPVTDTTRTKLSLRGAITQSWNSEAIWSTHSGPSDPLQLFCIAPFSSEDPNYEPVSQNQARRAFSPTLESAMNYYTKNGVPLDEDKTLDFSDITNVREAGEADKYNIHEGYRTSILNFDREPRFYANLGFDGSVWLVQESLTNETNFYLNAKRNGPAGNGDSPFNYNVTGYFCKKLVHIETNGATVRDYAFPEIRLADLYLMYAEALNEVQGPTTEVLSYVDAVRERAGLDGVVSSWQNFSTRPSKYSTKDGMREIIHKERSIEMAFEGDNFYDIRRWKKAAQEFNELIQGWNVGADTESAYYNVLTLYQQKFVSPRDYLWPLNRNTIIQNPNLVQNPGW